MVQQIMPRYRCTCMSLWMNASAEMIVSDTVGSSQAGLGLGLRVQGIKPTSCILEGAVITRQSSPWASLSLSFLCDLLTLAVVVFILLPHLGAPGRVGQAEVSGFGRERPGQHLKGQTDT